MRYLLGAVALAPFVWLLIAMATGRAQVQPCCPPHAPDVAIEVLPPGSTSDITSIQPRGQSQGAASGVQGGQVKDVLGP